ncbi:MAG: 2-C-methyl-D-erythritol 2,4-cyclodiphosphate synthase, partial [Proteobacteria bacterium]|nr:2-C-methyl-D-erythritol 2,4-cyclodiphosphate synthase [Pseudomonadota bacterium]
EIPFAKGLLGHSDADVLLHAVGDAILGALGLGDLGRHFPDTDPRYKNIFSLNLLEQIQAKAEQKGFSCINIDATIVAQEPKLAMYTDAMAENISRSMKVDKETVNIKAKTTEGLGFEGSGEGMSAYAVVLMRKT